MERNYDEILPDKLIHLDKNTALLDVIEKRMERSEKRMELTIRRMVKAEARLEKSEKRVEGFDEKLQRSIVKQEQSFKDQKDFSVAQSKVNRYFIDYINSSNQK